jgi:hypothetical protein
MQTQASYSMTQSLDASMPLPNLTLLATEIGNPFWDVRNWGLNWVADERSVINDGSHHVEDDHTSLYVFATDGISKISAQVPTDPTLPPFSLWRSLLWPASSLRYSLTSRSSRPPSLSPATMARWQALFHLRPKLSDLGFLGRKKSDLLRLFWDSIP